MMPAALFTVVVAMPLVFSTEVPKGVKSIAPPALRVMAPTLRNRLLVPVPVSVIADPPLTAKLAKVWLLLVLAAVLPMIERVPPAMVRADDALMMLLSGAVAAEKFR